MNSDNISAAIEQDNMIDAHKDFIRRVLMIIHTAHSHNVSGSLARLQTASRLFHSVSVYDSLYEDMIKNVMSELADELSKLRYASPSGSTLSGSTNSDVNQIKQSCLSRVSRLYEIVRRVDVREDLTSDSDNSGSAIPDYKRVYGS